jgi:hypothetical protein
MTEYEIPINFNGSPRTDIIIRTSDRAAIPVDPENPDYQQYLKWVEENNG